jgi:hypothetical protein
MPLGGAAGTLLERDTEDHMNIVELVDESAATALVRAATLQERLKAVQEVRSPELTECDAEVHRLITDIVSLRNAAELLKRTTPAS